MPNILWRGFSADDGGRLAGERRPNMVGHRARTMMTDGKHIHQWAEKQNRIWRDLPEQENPVVCFFLWRSFFSFLFCLNTNAERGFSFLFFLFFISIPSLSHPHSTTFSPFPQTRLNSLFFLQFVNNNKCKILSCAPLLRFWRLPKENNPIGFPVHTSQSPPLQTNKPFFPARFRFFILCNVRAVCLHLSWEIKMECPSSCRKTRAIGLLLSISPISSIWTVIHQHISWIRSSRTKNLHRVPLKFWCGEERVVNPVTFCSTNSLIHFKVC